MFRSALILAAIALALLYAFARFVRRTSMFFPERYPSGVWDTRSFDIQPEDQFFAASDGVRLHGWLFRAKEADAPLLIWFHGNGGNITQRASIAVTLATRGVSVFLFDWRGYGRSEGTPSESGLFRDALAAYDHSASICGGQAILPDQDRQDCLSSTRVVLYGESIGGPYAAYVATKRKAHAVILENSFPSLRELGNALYAPIPLGLTAPRALRTADWLNDAGLPVLVMHGKRDQIIPFRLGQRLYDGLKVPKEMLVSEEAHHCEIPAVEPARYYEAVVRWCHPERSEGSGGGAAR